MLSEGTSGPHPCWGPSNRSDGRGNSTPGVEDKQFSCRRLAGLGAGRGCRTRSLTIRGGRRKADRVRRGTSPSPCRLSLHVGPQCSALPRPRPHAPVGDPEDIPALGLSLPPPGPHCPAVLGGAAGAPSHPRGSLPAGPRRWGELWGTLRAEPGSTSCSVVSVSPERLPAPPSLPPRRRRLRARVRPTSPGPLTTSPPAAFPVQCPRGLCLPPTVPHLFLSRLCPRQAPADPRPGVGSQAPPTAPGSVPAPSCQALPSPQAKHPPA